MKAAVVSSLARPYRTEQVCVGLGLLEDRLVLSHGVLVHGLLCICLVRRLTGETTNQIKQKRGPA